MSKRVICTDDKHQPPGANAVEGEEYIIEDTFINSYDQVVYIVAGLENSGRTVHGLPWIGYSAKRFKDSKNTVVEEVNYNFALN